MLSQNLTDRTIEVKGIIWEDFVNYKKPCMTLMFPKCDFKCEKECGEAFCQNSNLAATASQTVDIDEVLDRYESNDITEAIVLQGLEPLDSLIDVYIVAAALRRHKITDDFIIYTGYTPSEIKPFIVIQNLSSLVPGHLIIKWGRYLPNQSPHYDPVLGINLASNNQYGELIK